MGLIARGTDSAKVVKVVRTTAMRGEGTNESPVRTVTQYWDFNGELLAENDGFINDCIKGTIGSDTSHQMACTKVLKENLEKVQNNVCRSLDELPNDDPLDILPKTEVEKDELIQRLQTIKNPTKDHGNKIGLSLRGHNQARGIVIYDKVGEHFVFNYIDESVSAMLTIVCPLKESMAKDIRHWFTLKEIQDSIVYI